MDKEYKEGRRNQEKHGKKEKEIPTAKGPRASENTCPHLLGPSAKVRLCP